MLRQGDARESWPVKSSISARLRTACSESRMPITGRREPWAPRRRSCGPPRPTTRGHPRPDRGVAENGFGRSLKWARTRSSCSSNKYSSGATARASWRAACDQRTTPRACWLIAMPDDTGVGPALSEPVALRVKRVATMRAANLTSSSAARSRRGTPRR